MQPFRRCTSGKNEWKFRRSQKLLNATFTHRGPWSAAVGFRGSGIRRTHLHAVRSIPTSGVSVCSCLPLASKLQGRTEILPGIPERKKNTFPFVGKPASPNAGYSAWDSTWDFPGHSPSLHATLQAPKLYV